MLEGVVWLWSVGELVVVRGCVRREVCRMDWRLLRQKVAVDVEEDLKRFAQ